MMNMKFFAIAVMAMIATAPVSAASLVKNGSFEQGVNPGTNPGYVTVGSSYASNVIDHWDVKNIDYIGSYWEASDGVRSIDLNGSAPGTIRQRVKLVKGGLYSLSWDVAVNPDLETTRGRSFVASLGNGNFEVTVCELSCPVPAGNHFVTLGGIATHDNMLWQTLTTKFVADSRNTYLSFVSSGGPKKDGGMAWGAAIDNVRLAAIPEPEAWAMLVLGFGLIGLSARHSNRRIVVSA
jgi:hypothetical protein